MSQWVFLGLYIYITPLLVANYNSTYQLVLGSGTHLVGGFSFIQEIHGNWRSHHTLDGSELRRTSWDIKTLQKTGKKKLPYQHGDIAGFLNHESTVSSKIKKILLLFCLLKKLPELSMPIPKKRHPAGTTGYGRPITSPKKPFFDPSCPSRGQPHDMNANLLRFFLCLEVISEGFFFQLAT